MHPFPFTNSITLHLLPISTIVEYVSLATTLAIYAYTIITIKKRVAVNRSVHITYHSTSSGWIMFFIICLFPVYMIAISTEWDTFPLQPFLTISLFAAVLFVMTWSFGFLLFNRSHLHNFLFPEPIIGEIFLRQLRPFFYLFGFLLIVCTILQQSDSIDLLIDSVLPSQIWQENIGKSILLLFSSVFIAEITAVNSYSQRR